MDGPGTPHGIREDLLTVGRLAELFDLTVRALHHYDEVGLLRPSERSAAGYRLYTPADVTRLQHVVVYRRLGFSLEEIGELLERPEDVVEHLRRQRTVVQGRLGELQGLVVAIDNALHKEERGMRLTTEEQKELFGEAFSDEYAEEAEQRWGDTDQWRQSQDRTASYTKEDWATIKAEGDAVNEALAAALRSGAPATSEAAMDAAEQHRAHLERWFYEASPGFHRNLGAMYVEDPRFTATFEDLEPGLAVYVRDAIAANADRQEG